jgi:acyl dehydratase
MTTEGFAVGQEFSGKPKRQSWERIAAFSGGSFDTPGWPKKNIHTDLGFAREMGLSTVYVSGTQYLGHLTELMIDLFGEGWLRGGRTHDLKFIKAVAEGDTIRIKARIQAREEAESAVKYTMNIWGENQDGDKVMVGTASFAAG